MFKAVFDLVESNGVLDQLVIVWILSFRRQSHEVRGQYATTESELSYQGSGRDGIEGTVIGGKCAEINEE